MFWFNVIMSVYGWYRLAEISLELQLTPFLVTYRDLCKTSPFYFSTDLYHSPASFSEPKTCHLMRKDAAVFEFLIDL